MDLNCKITKILQTAQVPNAFFLNKDFNNFTGFGKGNGYIEWPKNCKK
jgi:hypothetical protein